MYFSGLFVAVVCVSMIKSTEGNSTASAVEMNSSTSVMNVNSSTSVMNVNSSTSVVAASSSSKDGDVTGSSTTVSNPSHAGIATTNPLLASSTGQASSTNDIATNKTKVSSVMSSSQARITSTSAATTPSLASSSTSKSSTPTGQTLTTASVTSSPSTGYTSTQSSSKTSTSSSNSSQISTQSIETTSKVTTSYFNVTGSASTISPTAKSFSSTFIFVLSTTPPLNMASTSASSSTGPIPKQSSSVTSNSSENSGLEPTATLSLNITAEATTNWNETFESSTFFPTESFSTAAILASSKFNGTNGSNWGDSSASQNKFGKLLGTCLVIGYLFALFN